MWFSPKVEYKFLDYLAIVLSLSKSKTHKCVGETLSLTLTEKNMYICTVDKQIINTQVKLAALRSYYKELATCHLQSALPTHRCTLLGSAFLCTIATSQISLFYFSSVLLAVQ